MDKKRAMMIGGGIAALIVVLTAAAWFGPLNDDDSGPLTTKAGNPAYDAADVFAKAWVGRKLDTVPVTPASGAVADRSVATTIGLGPTVGSAPSAVKVTGLEMVPAADGAAEAPRRVKAALAVSWTFDEDRTWTYDSAVELVEQPAAGDDGDATWLVDWTPQVVHPRLNAGETFKTVRLAAKRGELLGTDGKALVGLRPVVYVGIQPGAANDPASAAYQVASIVGVDGDSLAERASAAGADDFVSAITLRQESFDEVSAALRAVPGAVFREDEIPLAPTRDWARGLIGTLGPATEEDVAASGGRVQLGETTGLSGLQAAQNERLNGLPGLSIRAVPDAGTQSEPRVIQDFPAVPGESLTLTLDAEIQAIADDVLANSSKPSALVAIRASTGDVLAVANGPSGSDGFNRAMIGTYAPGSTFKVASGLTLLENGLTPDTLVNCPATIVVGKEFRNAQGEVLGNVPFRKDFADSCNTAFVGQSREITSQQLADTAIKLGYRDLDIGVPVAGGSVPVTESETEHAANMIGQGRVEASPFVVALASASIASGRSVQPRLFVDPENPEPVLGEQLPGEAILFMRDLMRGVVTDGTGSAVLGIPGGNVYGKTGTAEFGTEDPPQSHAWFTGFQGDIAFAVLVEDGGFGGQVAAPLAAQFLTAIAEG